MTIANIVLNDFTRDNRVLKISRTLQELGHEVTVVALSGKGLPNNAEDQTGFSIVRLHLILHKLPKIFLFNILKYIELSLRIGWRFRRFDAWHCNDIEAYAIGLWAKVLNPKIQLIYDCHEFESERNALSKLSKASIGWFERRFIRYAAHVFVVSPSILKAYTNRYRNYGLPPINLLRNVPHANQNRASKESHLRTALGLSPNAFIAIYQGAFTYNRGIEQMLEMAKHMKDDEIELVFMGYGLLEANIKKAANALSWVHFHPAVNYEDVPNYSAGADVGLISVKPTCLSYLYCLPNKLFEYIHAGLPVMVNELPDCQSLLSAYEIGISVSPDTPEQWRLELLRLKNSLKNGASFAQGLRRAQTDLTWETESVILDSVFRKP